MFFALFCIIIYVDQSSIEERIQVKVEFLRILVRLQVNSAEQRLLYGFFENYLKLTKEEEVKFMKEARELKGAEEILEIPISYEEKGKRIGRAEGRAEGREENKVEVARRLIREGVSKEIIIRATNLSAEKIEELKQHM